MMTPMAISPGSIEVKSCLVLRAGFADAGDGMAAEMSPVWLEVLGI
jgi:hypothetical protein